VTLKKTPGESDSRKQEVGEKRGGKIVSNGWEEEEKSKRMPWFVLILGKKQKAKTGKGKG